MTTTGVLDYTPHVAAGVAFLNEHRPGWRKRVDTSKLDLGSELCCILGQVYGKSFWAVLDFDLHETLAWADAHGFMVVEPYDDDDFDGDLSTRRWAALHAAWLAELTKERDASE